MEQDQVVMQKLLELETKLDQVLVSSEQLRAYFKWMTIVTVAVIVIPLLLLPLLLPAALGSITTGSFDTIQELEGL